MKRDKRHGFLIGTVSAAAVVTGWMGFCGYRWGWGPFARLHDLKTAGLPGNAEQYDLTHVRRLAGSPLEGKHILFLGSSVTYGAASQGVSFADDIAARNGCTITKEAVSGTTLVDGGPDSYISRLKRMDTHTAADLFVCQLSTNDATRKKTLGSVGKSRSIGEFDTKTVAGAIEYIIAYAKKVWGCPVIFYTNPRYDSAEYAAMAALLGEIREKWNITVIDMWNDPDFNGITPEQRELYLADPIHPTKAGYLQWWTPYMEEVLYETAENGNQG